MNNNLSEIVGHQAILDNLASSIVSDHLSHALLLHGKSGYGALPLGLRLAQMLTCTDRRDGHACSECSACHKSSQHIHPDIHFAFPAVSIAGQRRDKTTSVDFLKEWRSALSDNSYMTIGEWVQQIATQSARPDINVAECNQIFHQLTLQSFESSVKVQIIWMAEYLGNNGNRLLKLIEEPPEGTFIILICEDLDQVLGTIRSRCRTIAVPRVSSDSITTYLTSHLHLGDQQAQQIAQIAEGDVSYAISLSQIDNSELLNQSLSLLVSCHRRDVLAMKKWTEEFAKYNAQEQKAVLAYLLKLIREMLHGSIMGGHAMKLSEQEVNEIQKTGLQGLMNVSAAANLSDVLSDTLYMLSRNAHTKTLIYSMCLQIEEILTQ